MQHHHQSNSSPWRLPMSPTSDYPKPQYPQLQHTFSMVNLHDAPTWHFSRGPPSPTASSVSSTTSRSATPTSTSNNPWSNILSMTTTSTSSPPKESPNRTPQYHSRSTTPVAPQPRRPIPASTGFVPMNASMASADGLRGPEYPSSPVSNFPGSPNPYRQPQQAIVSLPPLHGFATPAVLTQYQSLCFELLKYQGLERPKRERAFSWALSNPRTSVLLGLCDDIAAWPRAVIFGLTDDQLPFSEEHLHGIATNPLKVLEKQWQVTSKALPRDASHVEFTPRETVPLQQIHPVRTSIARDRSLDRVRFLDDRDDRVFMRKRFVYSWSNQRETLLKQIQDFKQLDHKNIGKLLCSYSQHSPSVVGIVCTPAQYTLDEYLASPGDMNRPKLLFDWMTDLSQALDYLHAQSIPHRSIRPRKILIDGSRIYLAPFGIGIHHDGPSPTVVTPQRIDQLHSWFQDQSYIYAAPEAIQGTQDSRSKKHGRPGDVFSLGCVFLSMVTVAQNQSLSAFAQYRSANTSDASFHANLDRVATWCVRLYEAATTGTRAGPMGMARREHPQRLAMLEVIERMIKRDPTERVKMRKLAAYLAKGADGRGMGVRRRSIDNGVSGRVRFDLNAVTAASNGLNKSVGTTVMGSGIKEVSPPRSMNPMAERTTTTNLANGAGNGSATAMVEQQQQQRRPELSVFNNYFQQARYEQQLQPPAKSSSSTWGVN